MRLRFFLIILTVLIASTAAVTYVQHYFFLTERLSLIDTQIRKTASILATSELAHLKKIDLDDAEDILTEELGADRVGKVFIIRNSVGEVLYASKIASSLGDLPRTPQWATLQTEDYFVRILNLHLSKLDRTLQVGLVLDKNFLKWTIINRRLLVYIGMIIAFAFAISAVLTVVLLAPIRRLAGHLETQMANLSSRRGLARLQGLPPKVLKKASGVWSQADEFARLVKTTQSFIRKTNLYYDLTRNWTSQMAHELKTPLTLTRTEMETAQQGGLVDEKVAAFVLDEIDHIGHIINQFLEWADLENSSAPGNLHAVRLGAAARDIGERLDRFSPGRLRVRIESPGTAIANPLHVDLMITNLVMNALKFSPAHEPVDVTVRESLLRVEDRGGGLPKEVMARLGHPFNKGRNPAGGPKGSGLGLAWVAAMARLYQWRLDIETSARGTSISVFFPPVVKA